MKYFMYFVAVILGIVILTYIGVELPEWMTKFIGIWVWSYIGVHIWGLLMDGYKNRYFGEKVFEMSNEKALRWSLYVTFVIYILTLLPIEVSTVIVLVVMLIVVINVARSFK